ncbi:hypothetical protein E3Q23_00639 [Wallemia mellicola]|uniref:DUF803-domain-containing protein n=1 Tax=Wallemia mellicola TaxID=1708541 RepID=A0A4T0M7H6_9BASI|nr:hypothetical protein E3Q23_00639 [Wallemia mellicola]TIB93829.1 DUF803-domain-containing protein [Wallemia mellicola]TIC04741.1 DUF803-domain-containing protein [Wallemia mellicola]TIC13598.1 DUF803-domain-containing protein [Wallemia mellicola]TIC14243.1 DUF803-domain-containing protein [Wallemia mellicola]
MQGNLIGVTLALLGNIVIALGLNFQKLSHLQITSSEIESGTTFVNRTGDDEVLPAEDDDRATIKPTSDNSLKLLLLNLRDSVVKAIKNDAKYLKSGTFWIGLGLTTLGESSNFIAYGLSPAPLVAPLGSVALVANCLFSPLLLKEHFGLQEILGSSLCIIGAFVLIASNKNRDGQYKIDYEELLEGITHPTFQIYVVSLLIAIIGLISLSNKPIGQKSVTIDVSICALFGGLTVISTKALSSLLVHNFADAFRHKVAYLALSVLLITAAAQVHFLNKALNKFDSKIVIPIQYIFFTISVILGSSMLFKDIQTFPYLILLSGLTVSFCGVYFLSCAPQSDHFSNLSAGIEDGPQRNQSTDTTLTPLLGSAPERIRTSRSNSSFTKVGIGLSPARYLLASHSPNSTFRDDNAPIISNNNSQTYNGVNYGTTPRTTDLMNAYDLSQTPTPYSSGLADHFSNSQTSRLSPRSKASNLFGDPEDSEITPRQQHIPTFSTTSTT